MSRDEHDNHEIRDDQPPSSPGPDYRSPLDRLSPEGREQVRSILLQIGRNLRRAAEVDEPEVWER